jgi:cbb3-type cytochrome oxidase subunit 3
VDTPRVAPRLTWVEVGTAVALVHLIVFLFLYTWPVYRADVSTITQYYDHAARMALGEQPYRDFVFEYPPLAVPLFFLPILGVSDGDVDAYRLRFALEQVALALALAWLGLAYVRRHYAGHGVDGLLIAQPVFLLMAGVMATLERYDLAPALATLAALYTWPLQRGLYAWPLLAVGTALKVYPALLVPLFALEQLRRGERRELVRNAALFLVTLALAFLPFLATGPAVVQVLFAYHGDRGLEVNSLWATPLLLRHTLGAPLDIVQDHASEEVVAPGAALLSALSVPVMLLLLGLVYWLYWRQAGGQVGNLSYTMERLGRFSALAILAFILPNKVLSPQYLVWLIPLIPLLRDQARWAIWILFAIALALTQYIYPHHWVDLTRFLDQPTILAVTVRNIALIPLFVLLLDD